MIFNIAEEEEIELLLREDKEMADQSLEDLGGILEEVLPPEEKLQEHKSQAQKSGCQSEGTGWARGKIPPGFNLSTKTPVFPYGRANIK